MKRHIIGVLGAVAFGLSTATALAEDPQAAKLEPVQTKDAKAAGADAPPAVMGGHCDNCARGRFEAGGTFYYLKPHWDTNPAFSLTTVGPPMILGGENFDWDYEPAFGVWAGYTGATGLGFRARYFRFDQDVSTGLVNDGTVFVESAGTSGNSTNISFATPGDDLQFSSRLNLQAFDAEITQEFRHANWSVVLGGGLRYAYISQGYLHTETPLNNNVDAVAIGHNFTGWGLTGSLDARRALGDSCLTLIGSARGSLVWGDWRQRDFFVEDNVLTEQGQLDQDRFLPVLELELGAEWSRAVGRAHLFVAGGATGQVWFHAGNAANNDHFHGVDDWHNNQSDLGLLGFFVRAGIRY